MSVTFDQLLESVTTGDIEKLQAKKAALLGERTKLQTSLAKVNSDLSEIDGKIAAPIRSAVKAAQALGLEIPEKYRCVRMGGTAEGKRSQGKFSWSCNGMVPFQAEASRAMWRLSTGSGGSAGKKGEGVLTAPEFWALAKLDEAKVKLAEKNSVTLPNGKAVVFQRVED